jgi:hypothetical protein
MTKYVIDVRYNFLLRVENNKENRYNTSDKSFNYSQSGIQAIKDKRMQ